MPCRTWYISRHTCSCHVIGKYTGVYGAVFAVRFSHIRWAFTSLAAICFRATLPPYDAQRFESQPSSNRLDELNTVHNRQPSWTPYPDLFSKHLYLSYAGFATIPPLPKFYIQERFRLGFLWKGLKCFNAWIAQENIHIYDEVVSR